MTNSKCISRTLRLGIVFMKCWLFTVSFFRWRYFCILCFLMYMSVTHLLFFVKIKHLFVCFPESTVYISFFSTGKLSKSIIGLNSNSNQLLMKGGNSLRIEISCRYITLFWRLQTERYFKRKRDQTDILCP